MNFNTNSTTTNFVSTTEPTPPFKNDDYKYLVAPLVVIVIVSVLSIMVYLMARRRRMIDLRHRLLSLYEFDSNEEEWETLNSYENPTYTNESNNSTLC